MAIPGAITPITVSGQYLAPDGTPMAGSVWFTPSVTAATPGAILPVSPLQVALDNAGGFSVILAATDDADWAAAGFTYTVTEKIRGAKDRTYSIEVPGASPGGVLDLATVVPVSEPAIVSPFLKASGGAVRGVTGTPTTYPVGPTSAADTGINILSSFAGGEDDGEDGQFDSTGRLNLYSYQRADVNSYGETIRHFLMRKDAKAMEAWYFPSGGYDVNRQPVGTWKPVVWAGAHWEANNHASNHKHWSVETPDSDGSIETRFEVRFGNPNTDTEIGGLDKTIVATNLADFVVRCSNNQVLRLSSSLAGGSPKVIEFNHDYEGTTQYRRWRIEVTAESEAGSNAGTNFGLKRYDDTGTLIDTPIVVSRATGNVTLGPGFIARRASASVSSVSLNTTSLGGGAGVIAIANANTTPSGTPSGGGVLYVENGALKWKGSSGTVTTIASA